MILFPREDTNAVRMIHVNRQTCGFWKRSRDAFLVFIGVAIAMMLEPEK